MTAQTARSTALSIAIASLYWVSEIDFLLVEGISLPHSKPRGVAFIVWFLEYLATLLQRSLEGLWILNWKRCAGKRSLPCMKLATISEFSSWTEENHENYQPWYLVSGLRFEAGSSRIRIKNAVHSTWLAVCNEVPCISVLFLTY
jgi:hypothetical protein